jgi:hypothetical protein
MLSEAQILRITALKLDDLHAAVAIDEGQHAVNADVRLHLNGIVEQKPVQLVTPTVTIPLLAVLALVADRGGIRADRIYDLIVEAAIEAHEKGEPVGDYIEHSKRALATVKERVVARLPKAERNGQLRRIIEITDICVSGATLAAPPAKKRRGA